MNVRLGFKTVSTANASTTVHWRRPEKEAPIPPHFFNVVLQHPLKVHHDQSKLFCAWPTSGRARKSVFPPRNGLASLTHLFKRRLRRSDPLDRFPDMRRRQVRVFLGLSDFRMAKQPCDRKQVRAGHREP